MSSSSRASDARPAGCGPCEPRPSFSEQGLADKRLVVFAYIFAIRAAKEELQRLEADPNSDTRDRNWARRCYAETKVKFSEHWETVEELLRKEK